MKKIRLKKKMCIIFLKNYNKFFKIIKEQTEKSHIIIEETESIVKETMLYYGEKYPDMSPQAFFSIIIRFVDDVKRNRIYSS